MSYRIAYPKTAPFQGANYCYMENFTLGTFWTVNARNIRMSASSAAEIHKAGSSQYYGLTTLLNNFADYYENPNFY